MATAIASIDFDGTNDVIDYTGTNSSGSNLNITADNFTLLAWTDSDGTQGTIISRRDGASIQYQMYVISNTQLTLNTGSTGNKNISATWNTLGWVHLGITYENPGTVAVRYYEDGTSLGSDAFPSKASYQNVNNSAGARWAGYPTTGFPMNGRLGHIMIFPDVTLSAEQITEVMHNPGSVAGAGLWTGCWNAGSQIDLSGNGNAGTLTNGAAASVEGPPVFLLGGQ